MTKINGEGGRKDSEAIGRILCWSLIPLVLLAVAVAVAIYRRCFRPEERDHSKPKKDVYYLIPTRTTSEVKPIKTFTLNRQNSSGTGDRTAHLDVQEQADVQMMEEKRSGYYFDYSPTPAPTFAPSDVKSRYKFLSKSDLNAKSVITEQPDMTAREELKQKNKFSSFHNHTQRGLRDFLDQQFSGENMVFWESVEEYRGLPQSQRQAFATSLIEEHLAPNALQAVNVDSKVLSLLRKAGEGEDFPAGLFDAAQSQILDLMKFDCWPRLLKSDHASKTEDATKVSEAKSELGESKILGRSRRKSLMPWIGLKFGGRTRRESMPAAPVSPKPRISSSGRPTLCPSEIKRDLASIRDKVVSIAAESKATSSVRKSTTPTVTQKKRSNPADLTRQRSVGSTVDSTESKSSKGVKQTEFPKIQAQGPSQRKKSMAPSSVGNGSVKIQRAAKPIASRPPPPPYPGLKKGITRYQVESSNTQPPPRPPPYKKPLGTGQSAAPPVVPRRKDTVTVVLPDGRWISDLIVERMTYHQWFTAFTQTHSLSPSMTEVTDMITGERFRGETGLARNILAGKTVKMHQIVLFQINLPVSASKADLRIKPRRQSLTSATSKGSDSSTSAHSEEYYSVVPYSDKPRKVVSVKTRAEKPLRLALRSPFTRYTIEWEGTVLCVKSPDGCYSAVSPSSLARVVEGHEVLVLSTAEFRALRGSSLAACRSVSSISRPAGYASLEYAELGLANQSTSSSSNRGPKPRQSISAASLHYHAPTPRRQSLATNVKPSNFRGVYKDDPNWREFLGFSPRKVNKKTVEISPNFPDSKPDWQ